MVAPAWLPDPAVLAAYPDPQAPVLRYSWEFLRRNPRYQRRWSELIEPHYLVGFADVAKGKPDPLAVMRAEFGIWGIPPDPADAKTLPVFEHNLVRQYVGSGDAAFQSHEFVPVINLTWPLEPQFARALALAKERRSRLEASGGLERMVSARNHKERWHKYLRLLDGKARGLSTRELAAIVYPEFSNDEGSGYAGNRHVTKGLEAAVELRDRDWRLIPMLPDQ
jgi:hypothetical protein